MRQLSRAIAARRANRRAPVSLTSFEQISNLGFGQVNTYLLTGSLRCVETRIQSRPEDLAVTLLSEHGWFVLALAIPDAVPQPVAVTLQEKGEGIACSPGMMAFLLPAVKPVVFFPAHAPNHICFVLGRPDLLDAFAAEQGDRLPPRFLKALQDPAANPYHQTALMPPGVSFVLKQIIDCPYRASLKRLYLESKCLELIVLCLFDFLPSRL